MLFSDATCRTRWSPMRRPPVQRLHGLQNYWKGGTGLTAGRRLIFAAISTAKLRLRAPRGWMKRSARVNSAEPLIIRGEKLTALFGLNKIRPSIWVVSLTNHRQWRQV